MAGQKRSCYRGHIQDLTGERFTLLVAEAFVGTANGRSIWRCRCDCGSTVEANAKDLVRGHKKSCGCAKKRLLGIASKRVGDATRSRWVARNISAEGRIALPGELVALVDPDDVPAVSIGAWHAVRASSGNCYARCTLPGTGKKVLMHVLLMGDRPGLEIDHVNGNGLDNRRSNLRWATQSQNQANRSRLATAATPYKGVRLPRGRTRRWEARITCQGQVYHLGYFDAPEEAARAYDAKAKELHGEYARLNFPGE